MHKNKLQKSDTLIINTATYEDHNNTTTITAYVPGCGR